MCRILRLSLAVALVLFTGGSGLAEPLTSPASPAATAAAASGKDYWARPLDTAAKSSFDLTPASCKPCHLEQFKPWSQSLHSKSTGPGLLGQLSPADPGFAKSCYFCHAPAKRQDEFTSGGEGFSKNPEFDRDLLRSGVSCAICHLRGGIINGPGGKAAPHKGRKEPLFKDSLFCSACHQLTNGFALNNKPLTNTYKEWQASAFAEKGVHCQSCHMPNKEHLFLGIHDKKTVRDALEITINKDDKKLIKVFIKNTGAGHYLPTYVTPLIVVSGQLINSSGNTIEKTLRKSLIGRVVTLDLTKEIMDSRIAPGKTHSFNYRIDLTEKTNGPLRAIIKIHVYPDNFYNRFFKEALKTGSYTSKTLIKEALATTQRSSYLLFEETIVINK